MGLKKDKNYIFTSERLGFRNWSNQDLPEFAELNADPDVMAHFPACLSEEESAAFLHRLQHHFEKTGYTYFATEILKTGEFIGFIGMAFQDYVTEFTPAVDIGWRLNKNSWGKGYATEGAKRCLDFAFNELDLKQVIATCTENNGASEHVMKKIGMKKTGTFNHPKLKEFPSFEKCICYSIKKV